MNSRYKKWAENNKEHLKKYKKMHYKKNKNYYENKRRIQMYGINNEQLSILKEKQNNKCKICNSTYKISIDHTYVCELPKVRGLLCNYCNTRIAWYEKYHREIYGYLTGEWE